MAKFSRGQYALSISDRSGQAFPYLEMVREWTGAWVHISEYEPKSPLIQPKPVGADPQSLQRARPARTEFYTPKILPNDPLSTAGSTTVTVNEPDHGRSTGDAVRFRNVVSSVGGVSPIIFGLETTLASDLTDSATTLTLSDASAFPTSGYIVVNPGANDNETIKYTGKSSNDLTGLTRGSSAPTYNLAPQTTTASAHDANVKVRGSYSITKVEDDSYTFTLASTASTTQTGGGFPIFAGPVNARA